MRARNTLGCGALAAILLGWLAPLRASSAPFDLAGPRIDVRVSRNGKTLPIAQVPNLQSGDRLWVHPDLPANQSARYLMVVAFLRGATNPPPDKWFVRAETWTRSVSEEGMFVTVPQGAQQVLLLLAPETGGDYKTLRNAVRGRPGSFVRSSQDLDQASLERSRVNAYLDSVRSISSNDPAALHDTSVLLTRSLNLKLKEDCFDQAAAEQEQCLTQDGDQLVLNDGHSQSVVSALTSSAAPDLVTQLSYTTTAGAGYYSPYVGAVVDLARLLDSMHTAQYQYIPALSFPHADSLDLKLNNPPSFHNPKSVIVIALPSVGPSQLPPMRPVDPKATYCLAGKDTVLPAQGAPLVYSTAFAHGLTLAIRDREGKPLALPVRADASKGGFVVDASSAPPGTLPDQLSGRITGQWGFSSWEGPAFNLAAPHAAGWKLAPSDTTALIVGREDELHLRADAASCVSSVTVRDAGGSELPASFQSSKPDEIAVKVPLTHADPGSVTVFIHQSGLAKPDAVQLKSYAEAGHLDAFHLHAGDTLGYLSGTRLDEVAGLDLGAVHFTPGKLSRNGDKDALEMQCVAAAHAPAGSGCASLSADASMTAHVELKDGRTLDLPTTIGQPRPAITLLSKNAQASPQTDSPAPSTGSVHLTDPNELALGSPITFVVKTIAPAAFARDERVEIATADGSLHTSLTLADGGLLLQDASTVLGTFDPLRTFGPSAFGPLQMRPIDGSGTTGDWISLGTLVRVPEFTSLTCAAPVKAAKTSAAPPAAPAAQDAKASAAADPAPQPSPEPAPKSTTQPAPQTAPQSASDEAGQCTLTGASLYLVNAVSANPQFTNSVTVPDGFTGATLSVPRPAQGQLYIRLRDDPAVANTITFSATGMAHESARGRLARPASTAPASPSGSAPASATGAQPPGGPAGMR